MTRSSIISSTVPLKPFVKVNAYSYAKKFFNFIAQINSGLYTSIERDYEVFSNKK